MKKNIKYLLVIIMLMALLGGCDSEEDVVGSYVPGGKGEQPEASIPEEEDETAQSENVPAQEPAAPEDGLQASVPDSVQMQAPEAVLGAALAMEETPVAEPMPEAVPGAAPAMEETPATESTPEENTDIQADAPLGIPVLSDWAKTYDSAEDPNPIGDGVTFTITWNGVEGADGYEAEITSRRDDGTGPYVRTATMTAPVCEESFSHIYMNMKIKVRAYKETEVGRQYGEWSPEKEMSYSPV